MKVIYAYRYNHLTQDYDIPRFAHGKVYSVVGYKFSMVMLKLAHRFSKWFESKLVKEEYNPSDSEQI